jgi:hypothetical protein
MKKLLFLFSLLFGTLSMYSQDPDYLLGNQDLVNAATVDRLFVNEKC